MQTEDCYKFFFPVLAISLCCVQSSAEASCLAESSFTSISADAAYCPLRRKDASTEGSRASWSIEDAQGRTCRYSASHEDSCASVSTEQFHARPLVPGRTPVTRVLSPRGQLESIIACSGVTPVARILAPRGLVTNFQASYARVTLSWGILVPRPPYSLQAALLKP